MQRREAILARSQERPPAILNQLDFLMGVDDVGRMGGFRFKRQPAGPFLADDKQAPTPPLTDLRKLEHAAYMFEEDPSERTDEWIKILLKPGSSLGGARPKSNVLDENKKLWIAKFPSPSDDHDVGAWEWIVSVMARSSGITVSESKVLKLGHEHHTFLTQRFDRTPSGSRLCFCSGLTALGCMDGDSEEKSYLDLVGFIVRQSGDVTTQLKQLWRRIVFSILVSNSDDHLRNHGFIYNFDEGGWQLSPAFDMNPVPGSQSLTLNISERDNKLDLKLALEVAPFFRVPASEAKKMIEQTKKAVSQWKILAKKLKLKSSEIDLMASVFDK
jgi:serine/threonine-protein kinase HipA